MTPAKYIETVRLEAAKRELARGGQSMASAVKRTGVHAAAFTALIRASRRRGA
jgi:AraC-like DNA-binding protein